MAYIRKLLDGLDGVHLSSYHDASGINVLHILLTYMYLIFFWRCGKSLSAGLAILPQKQH